MDRFFFDVGIMEWPDASPLEDNGTPATIVLAKDVGNGRIQNSGHALNAKKYQ
jgi:hypothetical protein